MSRYITVTETAKLLRQALKESFPGIKFSVKSKSYSGGASIDVNWIDGPCEKDVCKVTGRYEGATFDGMIDLMEYHDSELNGETVHFGANFVFTRRDYSKEFLEHALAYVEAQKLGWDNGDPEFTIHRSSWWERDKEHVEYYVKQGNNYSSLGNTRFAREVLMQVCSQLDASHLPEIKMEELFCWYNVKGE